MTKQAKPGVCELCGKAFAKSGMSRHLLACVPAHDAGAKLVPQVLVLAEGHGPFWLHIDLPASARLYEIDDFLRRTWLECCDHMSQFVIGKTFYCVDGDDDLAGFGFSTGSMGAPLSAVFAQPGMTARYEYDMGSTTALKLRVVGRYDGSERADRVRLLARNAPPVWPCDECGNPATQICPHCEYERGGALLCARHARGHGCEGEEGMLPVVDSPRMGVCGYTGPSPRG